MGSPRRKFSREFKEEAVRLVTEGGQSLAQVTRDLDLRPILLRRWKLLLPEATGGDLPLDEAEELRCPEPGLLHPSDRGVQYAGLRYQGRLVAAGLIASMSRKGNCWDNAPMESWFATLKIEYLQGRDGGFRLRQEGPTETLGHRRVLARGGQRTPLASR